MTSDELTDKRMSHFVGIGLTLGFLLPHTFTALMLVNPLLCLFYKCYKQNRVFYKENLLVLFPLLITLLINLPQGVTAKAMLSCLTILLYFACFPMVGRVEIPNFYFYFILGFILISQVAYAFDISFMERLLNTYYPISEEDTAVIREHNTVNANNMLNYRLGGLYHNANHTSRYITFLLMAFLILNKENKIRKIIPFFIISLGSVFLTGSRTGFVVASLMLIAYLFVNERIASVWRTVVVIGAVTAFGMVTWLGSDTYRGLNVIQGFSNSANLKMDTFGYYLSSESSIGRLLLGYLDTSRFDTTGVAAHVMNDFDTDYGDIIFCFGFIGFFAILLYFFTVFLKLKLEGRLFFVLLLWMYSSTIITSFRASFVFMLLLSVNYSNNKITAPPSSI